MSGATPPLTLNIYSQSARTRQVAPKEPAFRGSLPSGRPWANVISLSYLWKYANILKLRRPLNSVWPRVTSPGKRFLTKKQKEVWMYWLWNLGDPV